MRKSKKCYTLFFNPLDYSVGEYMHSSKPNSSLQASQTIDERQVIICELNYFITRFKELKIEESVDLLNELLEKHKESKSWEKLEPQESIIQAGERFISFSFKLRAWFADPAVSYFSLEMGVRNKSNGEDYLVKMLLDNALACVLLRRVICEISGQKKYTQYKSLLTEESSVILFGGLRRISLELREALRKLPATGIEALMKDDRSKYAKTSILREVERTLRIFKNAIQVCDEAKSVSDSLALPHTAEVERASSRSLLPNFFKSRKTKIIEDTLHEFRCNVERLQIKEHLYFFEGVLDTHQEFEDCSQVGTREYAIRASNTLLNFMHILRSWAIDTNIGDMHIWIINISISGLCHRIKPSLSRLCSELERANVFDTGADWLNYNQGLVPLEKFIFSECVKVVVCFRLEKVVDQLPPIKEIEALMEEYSGKLSLKLVQEALKHYKNAKKYIAQCKQTQNCDEEITPRFNSVTRRP